MLIIVLLGIVALLSFAYRMRPTNSDGGPVPDEYTDEEREALMMTQLYRSEHLMRERQIREWRGREK